MPAVLPAQTYNTLYSFCSQANCADGAAPEAVLVQGTDGNLYATTVNGGTNGYGTVFKISPAGQLTPLDLFNGTDGDQPFGGLVQATSGSFYGITRYGGDVANCNAPMGCGTVFKMSPSGGLKALHVFSGSDGEQGLSTLVQATNGYFYGTASNGGDIVNCNAPFGCGTIFKISPNGTLTTLQSLEYTNGAYPYAGMIQATNGMLYGTMQYGGVNGYGTVYEITPSGTLTTLYNFCSQANCTDGAIVLGGLVQATNGYFYGTTWAGGTSGGCAPWGCGTVFRISPAGHLTTLYDFCSQANCTDGAHPYVALVQGTDGNLYGTTTAGGANINMSCNGNNGCGTVFKITPGGKLTTLYRFAGYPTDGAQPQAGLVQDTNGAFYGTTQLGGANNAGTVFSVSVGLGPFVVTERTSGAVGAAVNILGTDLTGATSVTFNGTPATFTVVSASLITTTVPTGATTGKVEVTTPSGTLSSNVPFRVP
jgi:uncharacterized repeat protein (TIGR03803 family)